ncbi:hypothetical protein BFINE_20790 [Bacteroides finegoldii DSM 17565]|nr:hypothetical protein BFINE_20790 [Bacteroides finegoldii DSM 17565]
MKLWEQKRQSVLSYTIRQGLSGQKQDFADNTHFNPYGAYQIAQCVIEGMKKAVPNLAKHLKIDPAYNPAYPDNPDTFHWNNSPFTEIEKPDGN